MTTPTTRRSARPAPSAAITPARHARPRATQEAAPGAFDTPPARVSARDRLLAAADELFYEDGIHTVGIDRVIERAGVAKASLYDTFGSKDALIRAYLEARHDARKKRITAWIERYDTPRERLLGIFDAMADQMKSCKFRGCAFTRAVSESAPTSGVRGACDDARAWMRELFAQLARDAGVADDEADPLATQLQLLYDGASVMGQVEGSTHAAMAARDAAAALLDRTMPREKSASARPLQPSKRKRASPQ